MAKLSFSLLAASLGLGQLASAGFDPSIQSNVAIYWGQNSYGQANSQSRLSEYCSNTELNIIPIAFMLGIQNPSVNFASAIHACTSYPGTQLLNCPQIAQDIKTCQTTYSKTILLSLGGATYTEGGFSSAAAAQAAANNVWNLFGPNTTAANRPFGSAVVDGFDFDFESTTQNTAPFAQELRDLMNAATSSGDKKYYLSAAPQCPFPDAAMNDMLSTVEMDFVMVQFYNNYCGIQSFTLGATSQNNFNMDVWDNWAKQSKNPSVKVLLGVPANTGAGGGYLPASQLAPIISYCKTFTSFGGVMMWDMSQMAANTGFLDGVYGALMGSSSPPTPSTSASTSSSSSATSFSTALATMSRSSAASSSSTMLARSSSLTSSLFGRQSTATAPTCACPTAATVTVTTTIFTGTASASKRDTSSTSRAQGTTASTTAATGTTGTTGSNQLVNQWGQCGGSGYTGPTQCKPPYTCVRSSVWWSDCR
ncbi:hypothetical protein PFICI_00721 [Pestalotiopsis fici W106-1]|uniref:chitinase n=1 Tax=Pestalotiopsis fici (strain W106-1 / CGMCC3.15140) TaxID=1229662 RepID=W3XLE7_PESFW|nr:uncharacterized protein PFICI_00721 [Pestalotiopsis fici W106-1]ETS86893.1 hypothetical protein PFICI_00721 [Pestalotiopsis fici W106-1]